jgi:hypothetical protein
MRTTPLAARGFSPLSWGSRHIDLSDEPWLTYKDLDKGMALLGASALLAALMSDAVILDRGILAPLRNRARPALRIDITPGKFWNAAHPGVARSQVYDTDGKVNKGKEAAFLNQLDPKETKRITSRQIRAAAKVIVGERIPGTGLRARLERWNAERTFIRAWESFMDLAGHVDTETGERYVTRQEIHWFLDGTYFYRLAQAREIDRLGKSGPDNLAPA